MGTMTNLKVVDTASDEQFDISEFKIGGATVSVNFTSRTVTVNKVPVYMSPLVLKIFLFLASHAETMNERHQILEHVYPDPTKRPDTRTIDRVTTRIRVALSAVHPDAGNLIWSVRGLGYTISSAYHTKK